MAEARQDLQENSSSEGIELLTADADGNAIPGSKIPTDRGAAIQYLDTEEDDGYSVPTAVAYRHKFFKRDRHGQPMEDTLVSFFVPDRWCEGGFPDAHALRLVEQRMGWRDDAS